MHGEFKLHGRIILPWLEVFLPLNHTCLYICSLLPNRLLRKFSPQHHGRLYPPLLTTTQKDQEYVILGTHYGPDS